MYSFGDTIKICKSGHKSQKGFIIKYNDIDGYYRTNFSKMDNGRGGQVLYMLYEKKSLKECRVILVEKYYEF